MTITCRNAASGIGVQVASACIGRGGVRSSEALLLALNGFNDINLAFCLMQSRHLSLN